jgi:dipeptidyl aminopeptidase/acylaminoacyl peptidase
MKHIAVALLCLVVTTRGTAQDKKRPMEIDDLFRLKRVADPQLSPDGKHVVYVVTTIHDVSGNKTSANLWLASTDGKTRRQLTTTEKRDGHPRWSPDGKRILFQSNRSGSSQLWIIDLDGGEPRQLTTISTGANSAIWSRDGTHIAFVSAVWPEYSDKPFQESDALNKKRLEDQEKNPVKAKVFTRLFFRHWDDYVDDKRQHLFVMEVKSQAAGPPRDVTPGDRNAYPSSSTFSSSVDFTFSPDGSHLLFTAPPKNDEAWSTSYDIWRVAIDGKSKPQNLTLANKAADSGPQFAPDGKRLAYRAQKRPGNEADRWELMVVDCAANGSFQGQPRGLIAKQDRSAHEFAWSETGLIYTADEKGHSPIWFVSAATGEYHRVSGTGSHGSTSANFPARKLAFTRASFRQPNEVMVMSMVDSKAINVSQANSELLDQLDVTSGESVTVPGADGVPMQMWILKPPGFDAKKTWPVAYIVHGGPQVALNDGWSFRWNPQLWAAQGYVVALPNFHGSPGFGQKYVDAISGDWGGKCFVDCMKGVDWLEKQPWIDKDRIGSAGASFGGYMMNWFAVNTGRFKCLITHCSVWNFESMYGTTDELWFDEWEHGGPPWGKNRHSYEKHSPHRLAGNLAKFKTPMLVIHNDLDFRCPIGQGHELFTTLQRQGVPSRMINFPDEGHWVLKPANSRYWHQEVFAWLKKHVPPGGR